MTFVQNVCGHYCDRAISGPRMGDGGKTMALELVLEDKVSFEATECNHLMLFKK